MDASLRPSEFKMGAIDEMEISYEGHSDDDIDINIDIELDNQDEDFILEDARSEAGTNDDVMIDEDNTSYNMEDADYMPDEDLQDVVDTETVEVSESDMLRAQDTDLHDFPPEVVASPLQDEDISTIADADTSTPKEAPQVEQPKPEQTSNTETEAAPQRIPSPEADVTHEKTSPVVNGEQQEEEKLGEQNSSYVSEEKEQVEIYNTGEPEQEATPRRDLISEERTVTVCYQGSEYALVAPSESADPDSYFLKDSSVFKEPLSAFFAAIRDILRDDVPVGEELMCTISDLGLEICETSAANTELSFSQIVDVHTTLVRNDGDEVMEPLYVVLLTKPEFGKVLESLVEDARQGKGLREVMETWNEDNVIDIWEESEELDEETSPHANVTDVDETEEVGNIDVGKDEDFDEETSAHANVTDVDETREAANTDTGKDEEFDKEASTHVNGADADETEEVATTDLGNEDWTEVDYAERVSPEPASLEEPADGIPPVTSGADELDTTEVTTTVDKDSLTNELIEPLSDKHDAETTKKVTTNGDHEAEENGDFIDYEDEEYAQGGNEVETVLEQEVPEQDKLDEHQTINESPSRSRRSSSRTLDIVDEEATSQPSGKVPVDVNRLAEVSEAADDFTADDINELVEATDEITDANGKSGLEAELAESLEDAASVEPEHQSTGDKEAEAQYEEEEDASYDVDIEDDRFQQSDHEADQVEEFNYNDLDTEAEKQINGQAENVDDGEISYEDDDHGSLLAIADNTEVDDTAVVTDRNDNAKAEKDEIDFEDDEDESPLGGSVPVTPSKPTIPGKRPHEEDGDAIDNSSQEAKRPRP